MAEEKTEAGCPSCAFRAKYDNDRKSLLGRLWRWHAGWCPGWRSYVKGLPEEERLAVIEKYDLPQQKFSS